MPAPAPVSSSAAVADPPLEELDDALPVEEELDEEKVARAKPAPVPGPSAGRPAAPAAPQIGLKELEQQIADERAQRTRVAQENTRLAQERDNAIRFAQEAERRGFATYELSNEQQIVSINEALDTLVQQHEQAQADGDFKSVAQINRKMGRLNADLAQLERDKGQLANTRERMTAQHQQPIRPAQRQPAEPTAVDPIERAIANRTEPTKAFLRKHPELIRGDGSLKRAAIDAHENALDAGYAVDTPGYFQHIEGIIGPAAASEDGAPVPRQRAPSMAGPVARTAAGGGGGGTEPGTFMATPKMRRLAAEQGVPLKEWVENYNRLLSEGRITPIT